jgi:hypothetical protein
MLSVCLAQQPKKEVWTDPNDKSLPADFAIQGEYAGNGPDGGKVGCQVIALGNGAFQAVHLPGGLPGAGWDGKDKSLMDGKLKSGKAVFGPTTGKRRYLAPNPEEFSATSKFPHAGQKDYTATIADETMTVMAEGGKKFELKRTIRKSPTLGKKAPEGAVVLFDGTNTDAWKGGRLDKETKLLNTDGHDIVTKQKFNNYKAHVEFLLPYRPTARGQGRGNSGFYQVLLYEVQILDSFGLDGKNNECGGIYQKAAPLVNLCLPPLQWQTYDVEFTNAVRDQAGKTVKKARITLHHNGVLIHDNIEISPTPGGRDLKEEGTSGPLMLQGHGNPLQFRNIWVVESK